MATQISPKKELGTYRVISMEAENATDINKILNSISDDAQAVNYAIRRQPSTGKINIVLPVGTHTTNAPDTFNIKSQATALSSTNSKISNGVYNTGLITPPNTSLSSIRTLHGTTYHLSNVAKSNVRYNVTNGTVDGTENGITKARLDSLRGTYSGYAITKVLIPRS